MLLSFVFKDFQQQHEHCLLRNMIIECHVRSDLSRPAQEPIKLLFQVFDRYFTFLPAISLFCPLFHFLPAISIRTAKQLTNQI